MGYAYSALIGDQGISVCLASISYVSFLTAGMMGFNVMQGSQIVVQFFGMIREMECSSKFWQCHLIRFNIIANLVTLIIIGLTSATAIILIGLPTIFQDINIFMEHVVYYFCTCGICIFWFIYNNSFNKDEK